MVVLLSGDSQHKTRRHYGLSDICVNHIQRAFLAHPFIVPCSCNTVLIFSHFKPEKLLCTHCSIALPAKAALEQKEKPALLFQLWLFKTFLSESVRLPENVPWICSILCYYCSLSVLNPLSFHSPLK